MSTSVAEAPAHHLIGLTPNGWHVISKITPPPGATGGNFSVGYLVSRNGTEGFLKALNYAPALTRPSPPLALQEMVNAFLFEQEVLELCRANRLSRISTPIDSGTVDVPGGGLLGKVSFLVFQRAVGDLRRHLSSQTRIDDAWRLRMLHAAVTGAGQLHNIQIAHQDIKPSNVLVYQDKDIRLGDLGRAIGKGTVPPHAKIAFAGDPTYQPPESFYGHINADWTERRLGCDAYMLGNLIYFSFGGGNITAGLQQLLDPAHRANKWSGTYIQLLPHLQHAFSTILVSFRSMLLQFHPEVAADIHEMVTQLCNPDPMLRGDPKDRRSSAKYSLLRYISRLDLVARRVEIGLGK